MRSSRNSRSSPCAKLIELVIELRFHQNLHDALRGAAQRERIFRAGRHQADAEALAQRIELVRQRDDLALRASRESNPPC